MVFTKLGAVVAWLGLVFGALRVVSALFLLFFTPDPFAAAKHYFNAANTGEMINEGLYAILLGISLGIAVEISRAIHKT